MKGFGDLHKRQTLGQGIRGTRSPGPCSGEPGVPPGVLNSWESKARRGFLLAAEGGASLAPPLHTHGLPANAAPRQSTTAPSHLPHACKHACSHTACLHMPTHTCTHRPCAYTAVLTRLCTHTPPCMHMHTQPYAHAYAHTHTICMHTHTAICTLVNTHTPCACTCICSHAHMLVHTHTCTHSHVCMHAHRYMHTPCIHVHTATHMHIHTRPLNQAALTSRRVPLSFLILQQTVLRPRQEHVPRHRQPESW